jgi:hypothetical protein
MVKATFTLDDVTVARLRRTAERLGKPQSQVLRDAIGEYAERVGRLSEQERLRLLDAFDTLVPKIPSKPARVVDTELRAIRRARRAGGRRSAAR